MWAKRIEDKEEAQKKAVRAQRFGLPGERATSGLRKLGLNAERVRMYVLCVGCVG